MIAVDLSKVVPVSKMKGDSEADTARLKSMLQEAQEYITSFQWCGGIREVRFGWGVGGVVAIFLFRIKPTRENVDEWLWVIVGDLPPAYLVTDVCPTPIRALEAYVREMGRWVEAVKAGKSVKRLIPVNVDPTREHAQMLQTRLRFLERKFLQVQAETATGGDD